MDVRGAVSIAPVVVTMASAPADGDGIFASALLALGGGGGGAKPAASSASAPAAALPASSAAAPSPLPPPQQPPTPPQPQPSAVAAVAAAVAPAPSPPAAPLIRGSARLAAGLEWRDGSDVLPSRLAKLQRLLEGRNCDAEALRAQVWGGAPARYRTAVWQMLLGYLPLSRDRQADSLARKKAEYQAFVDQFCGPRAAGAGMSDAEQTVLRQVLYDAKRTNPEVPLFHTGFVQRSLERVLFVYSQRHFATGYVQGINDLATPLYAVFLSPWADLDCASLDHVEPRVLLDVEADVYWCLARLVEGIQDHYTPSQPGIQKMIHRLRELVHRIDEPLVVHLESAGVEFHTFAFRWMNVRGAGEHVAAAGARGRFSQGAHALWLRSLPASRPLTATLLRLLRPACPPLRLRAPAPPYSACCCASCPCAS